MNHLQLQEVDFLLHNSDAKFIESQIIDYIMSLRNIGVSYTTIKYLIAPVFTFYQLNDVVLNRKKVSRYLGEFKRMVRDEAYSNDMIYTALQNVDHRMRCVILLLASTGCRIGALPSLTLGNLTKLPDYGMYKIVFYEGTSSENYTFCTRECAKTGIDNYLNYRKRCGEKIAFDQSSNRWQPSDAPLIRLQFDVNDLLQVKYPAKTTLSTLRTALTNQLVRSGLRQIEHPTVPQSMKRIRKSISLSNGFRKHVISTFIEAGLNHEIRELISHHDTHLDQNYFRPSEDQVLREFLKAEPNLTIDPNNRLKEENQILKVDINKYENMFERIEVLEKQLQGKLK
jgi:integrase